MAPKLLKAGGKRKVAAKRPARKTDDGSVVLAGTYREKQNFGDVPAGDITKQETHDPIPEKSDVVCAGFPLQAA